MKTAQELVEGLERVERQEHPSDKVAAWEAFVHEIQTEAATEAAKVAMYATCDAILDKIAARGIDVSDCDGDDEPAEVLANWIVGRIESLQENAREANARHANLVNQF